MRHKHGPVWPRAHDALVNCTVVDRDGNPVNEPFPQACIQKTGEGEWIVPHGRLYIAGWNRHGKTILKPAILSMLAGMVTDAIRSDADSLDRAKSYHANLLEMVFDRPPAQAEIDESLGLAP